MLPRVLVLVSAVVLGCSTGPQGPEPGSPATPPAPASATAAPGERPPAATPPKEDGGAALQTLFVDSKVVECEGEGTTTCLRVRESPSKEWTLFYRTIEGFTFEPGHLYELKVEVVQTVNPPSDGSSRRYRLVEILSRKRAP